VRVQFHRVVVVGLLSALAACQEAPPLYPASAPDEVRQACALTNRKCTACHDRDRIVDARHNESEWRTTIERMRRFAGSGISPADGEIILRCLSYSAGSVLTPASAAFADHSFLQARRAIQSLSR
jgi:hypothetical protein